VLNGGSRLLLKTSCQPASCRALPCVLRLNRRSPVACANCPLDGMDCCCLLLLCFVLCYSISTYVAPWLRAVCIFCVFYAVEYVVTAWRCSWTLLACFWGGRGDVVVVGRGGVLWVVGSSWWFSAFFHGGGWLWRRSSAGAAVLRVFTRLGRRGDWGDPSARGWATAAGCSALLAGGARGGRSLASAGAAPFLHGAGLAVSWTRL
jgi:hypothetical protein